MTVEYCPLGQRLQVDGFAAPMAVEYLPPAHWMQVADEFAANAME